MERITYQDIPKEMFNKLRNLEDFINNSSLEIKLLEIIRLRIAQINNCAYCVDMHHKELKQLKESELILSSLCVWQETPYFSAKERSVLRFTESLTKSISKPISDAIYNPLLEYFSKQEISYLTLAISQMDTWTKLMKTFQFTPGKYEVKK
jgi:AhpD family alkylhydroperoxidase